MVLRFDVTTELLSHGGEHLLREGMILPRAEARIQGRRQHFGRNRFFDRRLNRPAPFAGILHEPAVLGERGILGQRHRRQVQQPRTHHAAAPPDLGNIRQVEIVADIFGKFFAGRVLENVEALRVGLHHSVFDAVVDHIYEMSGTGRAAVDVAVFGGTSGGARHFLAARSARDVAASGRQRFEDRVEAPDGFLRATDHHAVAALQSPDAAAGADVHVVHALDGTYFGAANVVFEIRIAAVNDGVARLHASEQSLHGFFRGIARRYHDPRGARSVQLADQIIERSRGHRTFAGDTLDRFGAHVGHYHRVTAAHQASGHVGAHAPQTYHSQLHSRNIPAPSRWPPGPSPRKTGGEFSGRVPEFFRSRSTAKQFAGRWCRWPAPPPP